MDVVSLFSNLSVDNVQPILHNFAEELSGIHTEFVITCFPDYIHIVITQFEKIGNFYQVKIDQPENGISVSEPTYTITAVLGGDNLDAEVGVRYLVEKLHIRQTSLVCLSLRDYSRDTLNAIIDSIETHKKNQ